MQNTGGTKRGQDTGPQERPPPAGGERGAAAWGQFRSSLQNQTLFPYDPATTLLGFYPKELKTDVHPKARTQMFRAASFIMNKTWKPPRRPSVGDG